MTTIVHKRGTGIPAADDLTVGEIAIDTSTGTAYTKNNSGEVVPVGGDVDLSNYVTTDADTKDGVDIFSGGKSSFRWLPDTYSGRGGKYWVEIGQGVGEGATGSGFAALYIENGSGSFEVNYYSVLLSQMDLIGKAGSKISGFDTIKANDFLDAEGNPIHTDAKGNIFIGENALYFRGGYYNVAIGQWALINNAEGRENTAVGYKALQYNQTGYRNTGIGESANGAITNGDDVTAVGHSALVTAPDGSKELTAIGSQTGCPDPWGDPIENSTAIGFNAVIDVSNKIQLGNEQVTLVHTHGAMQATDYLDADGNSIIGGGGGGGIDFPEEDAGYAFLATPSGWEKFDGGIGQTEWLYKRSGTGAMCWEGKKGHNTMAYQQTVCAGFENQAAGKYDILIGNNNYDMGAYPTGHNILIGTNNQCVGVDGAIAIGKDHFLTSADTPAIGFAIGEGNTVEGSGIAIGRNVSARSGQVIIGEKQISFADDLVEAFTTLQSAIKDESTLEGVKGALTNALGGLIEKFEQKARVEPLQRMSAEQAEAAGQSARARLDA